MTSLSEIQQLVRDAVFESQADGPALRAITNHINASTGFSSTEHLLIYRRAILGTLVRAIANIFPVCKKLVGEEFFDGMAGIYTRKTPSKSPDLADYGESFADFIAEFDPAASLPYLPDVARLEWHWHRAFNAADETGIDIKSLGDVDDEVMDQIIFKLPVSASLLRSAF